MIVKVIVLFLMLVSPAQAQHPIKFWLKIAYSNGYIDGAKTIDYTPSKEEVDKVSNLYIERVKIK